MHEIADHAREQIRVELARRRWTQADLARALDRDPSQVTRYLQPETDVGVCVLGRIADALSMQWSGETIDGRLQLTLTP
jgi:transcriptional regulator with XRE-family HTH domain